MHFIRIILAAAETRNWKEARLKAAELVGRVVAVVHDESLDQDCGNRSREEGLN